MSHILKFAILGPVFSLIGLLLLETARRRREGIKLLLKNGASWRENPARRSSRVKRKSDLPTESHSANHPLISYVIGFIFMLLTVVVFLGIIHHRKNKRIRGLMNLHTQFFVFETCHIKEKPGTTVVYKWYNPLDNDPQGPFYGTSYDPGTGSLSKGKDLISRIAPFFKAQTTDDLIPATLVQDAPLAEDYMKVRDSLSPEQREGIKNKFHKKIKPEGHDCKTCHIEKNLLDLKGLVFAANRIENLKKLNVIGMLSKYEKFYMPELFSEPGNQDD